MATRTLPADWYTTTESLERDRAAVLRLGWQYIGPATDVVEPGSFTTGQLGSLPIVITRSDDGTLRGFANVCRHRGALIAEGCGKRRTLQCRYHGWTYKLDGSLHRSPGMTLDEEVRLPDVAVATLGPLLFAAADPDCEPLETALAPFLELLDRVAGVDPNRIVHRRRLEHTIAANWKVVVEHLLEARPERPEGFVWQAPLLVLRRAGAKAVVTQIVPHTFLRTRVFTHVFGDTVDGHQQAAAVLKADCESLQGSRAAGAMANGDSALLEDLHRRIEAAYAGSS